MRGQAFAVFKMLIAAAFAMGLLIIVYQATQSIGCPTPAVNEIENLMLQASKLPNECFERDKVCFDNGVILTSSFYENSLGLTGVSFNNNNFCSSTGCEFKQQVTLPVHIECSSSYSCNVYIGSTCS